MSTKIGLIGGTGDIGPALSVHFSRKYDAVFIGSRSIEKARNTVRKIILDRSEDPEIGNHLIPESNEAVVRNCENLVLTVPYAVAIDTVKELANFFSENQLLISAVAAIRKSSKEFVAAYEGLSVSESIQKLLPKVKVGAAFQTLPAHILYTTREIDADVFVACDDKDTYTRVAEIVSSIQNVRPLYAGSLELSREIEGLTALLLNSAQSSRLKNPTLKILSF
jgi:8-hydroxy-5-deazaflavin:NADPH oxidoreductase